MRPNRFVIRLTALVVSAALLAAACGGGDDERGSGNLADLLGEESSAAADPEADDHRPSGDEDAEVDLRGWDAPDGALVVDPASGDVTFDAELSSETQVVDQSSVVEVRADHTYVLDPGAARGLEPGSVLLIPGTALRRVVDLREGGGGVEVRTEFAALTDAIDDGDISWDVDLPIDARFQTDPDGTAPAFVDAPASAAARAPGVAQPVGMGVTLPDGTNRQVAWVTAEDGDLPLQWKYSENGLDYVFALGLGAERVDVRVQVTREVGGGVALAYVAEGHVRMPRTRGEIEIRGGELSAASIEQGLSGEVELTVSAAGAGQAPIDFEMPGIWFKYIVPVGPIPLTIDVNARVIGDIEVPAGASAQAEARYSFGGEAGFELSGASVAPSVTMPDLGLVPEPADSAAMIGNNVNAEFGLAFPHVSVSLFDQGVVPRVYPGMILGSRLQWGPLCKSAYVNLVVQGAYDFKILGVNLLSSDPVDLIEPRRIDAEGDSCEG